MNIGFASYKFSQGCICKIFPIKCDWTDRKVATVREWPWRGSVLKATLRLSCCQWMTHASLPENPTNVYKLLLAWNWDPVAAVNTISLQRLEMQSLYLFLARGGRVSKNMKNVTALIDFLYRNGWIPRDATTESWLNIFPLRTQTLCLVLQARILCKEYMLIIKSDKKKGEVGHI